MLTNLKQIYGNQLHAQDGLIGHVKDIYFDELNWQLRYLVVDTGNWLPGRQVLLPLHVLGNLGVNPLTWNINLSKQQIAQSPAIETHQPVSRQYQTAYHQYFNWPLYWETERLLPTPPQNREDSRLRSTLALADYKLISPNGTAGHLADFLIETEDWKIQSLIGKVGLFGKEVQIPTAEVTSINFEQSSIVITADKNTLKQWEKAEDYHPLLML